MSQHTEWLLVDAWMNLQIALANAPPGEKDVVAEALAGVDKARREVEA